MTHLTLSTTTVCTAVQLVFAWIGEEVPTKKQQTQAWRNFALARTWDLKFFFWENRDNSWGPATKFFTFFTIYACLHTCVKPRRGAHNHSSSPMHLNFGFVAVNRSMHTKNLDAGLFGSFQPLNKLVGIAIPHSSKICASDTISCVSVLRRS